MRETANQLLEGLTRREMDVAAVLAEGLSYRDIADELSISEATVRSHVKAILAKTGVATSRRFIALANRRMWPQLAIPL